MHSIWSIARYEYSRHVRRRSFLFTALGVPLLIAGLIAVIGFVVSRSGIERRLGLVDQSGRFAQVDVGLLGLSRTIPMEQFSGEPAARRAFDAATIDAYVVVPADYLQTGSVRATARRPLSQRAENQVEALLRQGLLSAAAPSVQARLHDPADLVLRTPNSAREISANNALLFLLPYAFALLFFITTFTTSGFLLQAVAEEKEDRVMEILATTVSPRQMMAGKLLGLSGVGLTQMAIWLALAAIGILGFARDLRFFTELQLPWGVLGLALLYFLLGYLLIAASYGTAGAMVTTPQEAQPLVTPVTLLGMAPLMLTGVIVAQPNSLLAVILSLIPFSAPMTMLMRLPLADIPAWQIATSLLLLFLGAAGAVLLSARVLRLGMLRYGKRLRLRELVGGA